MQVQFIKSMGSNSGDVVVIDLEGDSTEPTVVTSEIRTIQVTTNQTSTCVEHGQRKDKKQSKPTKAFRILTQSLSLLSVFGKILGTEMDYQWKRNLRFILAKGITAFFWSQIFYTQFLHVYKGASIRTLEQFAMYGIGISVIVKLACFEKNFKTITALYNSTLKICQRNSGTYQEKLWTKLHSNFKIYKFLSFLSVLTGFLFFFYPVYFYIVSGKLIAFVPIEFMFIDQSTKHGLMSANIITAVLSVYAVSTIAFMGLSFDVLIMNYAPCVDLIQIDINELDGMWSNPCSTSLMYRHMFLRNICRKFIDMREYIAAIKKAFDQPLFVFFSFAYLSQIISMYQIRVNNWIPGYALTIGMFVEMIFYCLMGTEITTKNQRLCYILTQSKWYTYDVHSQKLILTLLNLAMNNGELWIGPLKPLSVFTATEIVKSIYTYYTIIMEIL